MILAKIDDAYRYYSIHPLLEPLFAYIGGNDLLHAPEGRIELQGNRLFINNGVSALRAQESQGLEAHRLYLDVHIPLDGVERIGWTPADLLGEPTAAYNEQKDIARYAAPAETYFEVHPGEFCIVFPEDAHAPIVGEGSIHKATAKIRL